MDENFKKKNNKKKLKLKNKRLTAIILSGGFGTRMDNLTKNKHKSMLSVGGFPILAHLYTQLRINLIKNIIICVGYKSENINRYLKKKIFRDSDKILKKIKSLKKYDYPIVQTSKLPPHQSTSQRIYKIRSKIADDDFIFLYGDTLLKPRIKKLRQLLKKKKNWCCYNFIQTITKIWKGYSQG